MEISKIVERINNGEKVGDVAKSLNMAQSTLSRKLKTEGYNYNNKTKVYELRGKSSENVQSKVEESNELKLTKDEIMFVKDSYKRGKFFDRKFEVAWEKSQLPSRKPEKKTPYIISQKTFEEFKDFSSELEEEYRITQNELVEIALQKLMKDWS